MSHSPSVEVIATGSELLAGQHMNTNAVHLSRELSARGFLIIRHQTLGDDLSRLVEAIQQATAEADIVITTGGLGPTLDDMTRDAISQATCEIALELSAKAIISSTMSGHTARMVAKHRPATPIIAVTPNPETQRRLSLIWGVYPLLVSEFAHTDQMIETAVQAALDEGMIEKGDTVVITAGVPLGGSGRTNMLKVHVVE